MADVSFDDCERLVDLEQLGLGEGLAIWKVHLSLLREQRKNARYMEPDTFSQLADNIADESRLESLVFAHLWESPGGDKQFQIISGHHRTRAAREAGVEWIAVLVDERDLSKSEIKSKQLAHNALSGQDDPQVLQEIYEEIDDIDARIASGIDEEELDFDVGSVTVDTVDFGTEFETITLHFLPEQFDEFDRLINRLDPLDVTGVARYIDWPPFKKLVRKVSAEYDVRNMAAIVVKMMRLARERLDQLEEEDGDDEEEE